MSTTTCKRCGGDREIWLPEWAAWADCPDCNPACSGTGQRTETEAEAFAREYRTCPKCGAYDGYAAEAKRLNAYVADLERKAGEVTTKLEAERDLWRERARWMMEAWNCSEGRVTSALINAVDEIRAALAGEPPR